MLVVTICVENEHFLRFTLLDIMAWRHITRYEARPLAQNAESSDEDDDDYEHNLRLEDDKTLHLIKRQKISTAEEIVSSVLLPTEPVQLTNQTAQLSWTPQRHYYPNGFGFKKFLETREDVTTGTFEYIGSRNTYYVGNYELEDGFHANNVDEVYTTDQGANRRPIGAFLPPKSFMFGYTPAWAGGWYDYGEYQGYTTQLGFLADGTVAGPTQYYWLGFKKMPRFQANKFYIVPPWIQSVAAGVTPGTPKVVRVETVDVLGTRRLTDPITVVFDPTEIANGPHFEQRTEFDVSSVADVGVDIVACRLRIYEVYNDSGQGVSANFLACGFIRDVPSIVNKPKLSDIENDYPIITTNEQIDINWNSRDIFYPNPLAFPVTAIGPTVPLYLNMARFASYQDGEPFNSYYTGTMTLVSGSVTSNATRVDDDMFSFSSTDPDKPPHPIKMFNSTPDINGHYTGYYYLGEGQWAANGMPNEGTYKYLDVRDCPRFRADRFFLLPQVRNDVTTRPTSGTPKDIQLRTTDVNGTIRNKRVILTYPLNEDAQHRPKWHHRAEIDVKDIADMGVDIVKFEIRVFEIYQFADIEGYSTTCHINTAGFIRTKEIKNKPTKLSDFQNDSLTVATSEQIETDWQTRDIVYPNPHATIPVTGFEYTDSIYARRYPLQLNMAPGPDGRPLNSYYAGAVTVLYGHTDTDGKDHYRDLFGTDTANTLVISPMGMLRPPPGTDGVYGSMYSFGIGEWNADGTLINKTGYFFDFVDGPRFRADRFFLINEVNPSFTTRPVAGSPKVITIITTDVTGVKRTKTATLIYPLHTRADGNAKWDSRAEIDVKDIADMGVDIVTFRVIVSETYQHADAFSPICGIRACGFVRTKEIKNKPTNLSQFTNDLNIVVPTKLSDLQNDFRIVTTNEQVSMDWATEDILYPNPYAITSIDNTTTTQTLNLVMTPGANGKPLNSYYTGTMTMVHGFRRLDGTEADSPSIGQTGTMTTHPARMFLPPDANGQYLLSFGLGSYNTDGTAVNRLCFYAKIEHCPRFRADRFFLINSLESSSTTVPATSSPKDIEIQTTDVYGITRSKRLILTYPLNTQGAAIPTWNTRTEIDVKDIADVGVDIVSFRINVYTIYQSDVVARSCQIHAAGFIRTKEIKNKPTKLSEFQNDLLPPWDGLLTPPSMFDNVLTSEIWKTEFYVTGQSGDLRRPGQFRLIAARGDVEVVPIYQQPFVTNPMTPFLPYKAERPACIIYNSATETSLPSPLLNTLDVNGVWTKGRFTIGIVFPTPQKITHLTIMCDDDITGAPRKFGIGYYSSDGAGFLGSTEYSAVTWDATTQVQTFAANAPGLVQDVRLWIYGSNTQGLLKIKRLAFWDKSKDGLLGL